MFEIIFWSGVITVGTFAYGILNGGFNNNPQRVEEKRDDKSSYYDLTYDYIKNLSYEEIDKYINENYSLSRYKNWINNNCSMTDKHQIAKRVAEISEIEGRPYTNRWSNY